MVKNCFWQFTSSINECNFLLSSISSLLHLAWIILKKKRQDISQSQSSCSCVTMASPGTYTVIVESQEGVNIAEEARDNHRGQEEGEHVPESLGNEAALETERDSDQIPTVPTASVPLKC